METQEKELPIQWQWQNQTFESIEKHAQWFREDRKLGGGSEYYFDMAGKLLRLSTDDYFLIVPVFYQTVIGLERALRVHYKPEDEIYASCVGSTDSFANLLQRAVDEEVIHDDLFNTSTLEEDGLKKQIQDGRRSKKAPDQTPSKLSYSQQLALSIPELRNAHFHGDSNFLTPGILEVAIDLRIIADTLKTKGIRSLVF